MGVTFDGDDDFLETAADNFLPSMSDGTISAWINHDGYVGSNDYAIVGAYDGGAFAEGDVLFYLNNDKKLWMLVGLGADGAISADYDHPGIWKHVAVTWHAGLGGFVKLYIDGALVGTDNTFGEGGSRSAFGGDNEPRIGADADAPASDRSFDGKISEVAIWDTYLSLAEILLLAKARKKRLPLQIKPANLECYWPLDDVNPGTSGDGKTFRDLSGNDNYVIGDDGAGTGLTCIGEEVLSYPSRIKHI